MRLRCFTIDDYDAVRRLWEQSHDALGVGRSDAPEEIAKKLEHDPDLFLIAEDETGIIGTVVAGFDGRRGLIYHLAVDEAHRGRGLGSLLMQEVERRLAAKGCLRAYLLIRAQNRDVTRFYEKTGWETMSVTIMGKNLK